MKILVGEYKETFHKYKTERRDGILLRVNAVTNSIMVNFPEDYLLFKVGKSLEFAEEENFLFYREDILTSLINYVKELRELKQASGLNFLDPEAEPMIFAIYDKEVITEDEDKVNLSLVKSRVNSLFTSNPKRVAISSDIFESQAVKAGASYILIKEGFVVLLRTFNREPWGEIIGFPYSHAYCTTLIKKVSDLESFLNYLREFRRKYEEYWTEKISKFIALNTI